MVQPQMDWDRFRNVSNLVLVEPNQIRDSIYACIISLFGNFLTRTVLHALTFNDVRYSPDDSSNVNYFFVADVKCGFWSSTRTWTCSNTSTN